MNVRIVVDSSTDITPEVRDRLTVVPLSIFFGEKEYIDGIDIDHNKFYKMLVESDVIPTTSQASPAAYTEIFQKAADAGESVVVLTIASTLSGTYQSAMIAAEDFDNVYVVDSQSVTIGAGILAEYALTLAESGMDAASIAQHLTEVREKVVIFAVLDTLEYLKKGGRISATVAMAGTLLAIKPVVSLLNGDVNILGKARGNKQGNHHLVKEIENVGGVDFTKPFLLGYTGLSDTLLEKFIDDSKLLWEEHGSQLRSAHVGSAVGTHVGPGGIAAAFFKK
ncbi:MAG: DegV family protein [Ruminococcaceae bacterium]|nr:DegV family protein [Oscillospiraceae bacterium]